MPGVDEGRARRKRSGLPPMSRVAIHEVTDVMSEIDGQCGHFHQSNTDVHLHGSLSQRVRSESETVVTDLGPGPLSPVVGATSPASRTLLTVRHHVTTRGSTLTRQLITGVLPPVTLPMNISGRRCSVRLAQFES
jgi:hypothetical protein